MADRTITSSDFDKAQQSARFESALSSLLGKRKDLLSLYKVTSLIKPESEAYIGMRAIPVNKIIGSENRYHDFSSSFLPKNQMLKARWESIDAAQLDNIILPPISVYKVGDAYFVRDGNHRVSVARAKGQEFIDAEVVELSAKLELKEGMTDEEIKKSVVNYERERFIEQYKPDYLPMDRIVFTVPGAYPEMVNHILTHKYYINQNSEQELTFREGAISWLEHVYLPIAEAINREKLTSLFPGQSEADLYMQTVRKWDEMKRTEQNTTEEDAARAIKEENKQNLVQRIMKKIKH